MSVVTPSARDQEWSWQLSPDGKVFFPGTRLPLNTGPDKYLELLKRSLLDLLRPETRRMLYNPSEVPQPTVISEDERYLRLLGLDWSVDALTMVGYERLSNIQACIEYVLRENIPGDIIEAGVWRGGVGMFARECLGNDERRVWLADSFDGFPDNVPASEYGNRNFYDVAYLRVAVKELQLNFERYGIPTDRIVFLEGWFADTLPTLDNETWSLVRLDGDTYESTKLGLDYLYPQLSSNGFLIVDDYRSVEGCAHAVDEFLQTQEPIEVVPIDSSSVYWQKPQKSRGEKPDAE